MPSQLVRKYYLETSHKLRSKLFFIINKDHLYETAQLLQDIQFSVLAQTNDIVSLKLFDRQNHIINFDYVASVFHKKQVFTSSGVQLTIDFQYQRTAHDTYILCCPVFTIIKHPSVWCPKSHYGQCGQSCPCCRAHVGDIFGVCPICSFPDEI